jgi:hypothetical protein
MFKKDHCFNTNQKIVIKNVISSSYTYELIEVYFSNLILFY